MRRNFRRAVVSGECLAVNSAVGPSWRFALARLQLRGPKVAIFSGPKIAVGGKYRSGISIFVARRLTDGQLISRQTRLSSGRISGSRHRRHTVFAHTECRENIYLCALLLHAIADRYRSARADFFLFRRRSATRLSLVNYIIRRNVPRSAVELCRIISRRFHARRAIKRLLMREPRLAKMDTATCISWMIYRGASRLDLDVAPVMPASQRRITVERIAVSWLRK